MKVIRFFMVLAFGFTLFVTPAYAQAAEKAGFIVLVNKQADSTIPLAAQAEQAFSRLQPRLAALKRSGQISSFTPDLSAGLVRVKYVAQSNITEIANMEVLDNVHDAFAKVPHRTLGGLPEAISPVFYPTLWSSCFDATGLGASSYVVGSLTTPSNVRVGNYAGYADGTGALYDCFDWNGNIEYFVPGYKLSFKVYATKNGTLLGSYSINVPYITFSTFDKTNSIVTGKAPVSKPYSLYWYHANLNLGNTSVSATKTGTIPANGLWSVDVGTTPMRSGDYLDMSINLTSRFVFDAYAYTPYYTYCALDDDFCNLKGYAALPATLNITHAGTAYNASGKFDPWGWYSNTLVDTMGLPVLLQAGDTITATGISTYNLPTLTASPNFSTNVISGKAPAGRNFYVYVYDVYNGIWYSVWTHADASGNYAANFTSQFDLKATDALTFEVYYVDMVTGNRTDHYIPYAP